MAIIQSELCHTDTYFEFDGRSGQRERNVIITIVLAGACALLLAETALFLRNLSHLERLDLTKHTAPASWPRVSVIMAAKDEAHAVGRAVRSRLDDDYPNLQVVLVDDRSTDGTGLAAVAAADGDARFTVVRVDTLPSSWLGKVHAMREGLDHADGDWLLFSDADVMVERGTLRRAIALCSHEEVDLLALIPAFKAGSFFVDGVWMAFLRGLIVMADPAKVRDPGSKVVLGAGAFNLVRRSAYEATAGLEHLRMETGDDVALASMVKNAGGRVRLVDGARCATVAIYRSIPQLLKGIEKNGSTTAAVAFPLLLLGAALLLSLLFAPFFALASGLAWLRILGVFTLVAYTVSDMYGLWRNTGTWLPAIVWPVGVLIMVFGVIRATWLARRNGGVWWRGTFYSLGELAEGRRFMI